MVPEVSSKLPELAALCLRAGVARLELFGSGTGVEFDPHRSDLDFIVEFQHPDLGPWVKSYFELQRGLEAIFGRPVDLLLSTAIRGSYFRSSVDATRIPVYAAA